MRAATESSLTRHAKLTHARLPADRAGTLSSRERADLDGARAELARLRKVKDEYAKAHPEQREAAAATTAAAANAESSKQKHSIGELARSVNVQGIQISLKQKKQAEAQGLRFDKKGRLLNPRVFFAELEIR